MSAQLPLALRWPHRQRFEGFHAGENAPAVAAIKRLAECAEAPWVYLHGSVGSGRSHLLIAACHAALAAGRRVQYLPLGAIDDRTAALRGVAGSELLALDDLHAIAGHAKAEHALFDLYNQARAEGSSMLFAANAIPTQLNLQLPDLRSRLGSCTQFALKPLSDTARREVLKAEAAARGMSLDEPVLDWLFARYARDLGALLELLEKLDQASLAAQRRITVPFLRELLRAGAEPSLRL